MITANLGKFAPKKEKTGGKLQKESGCTGQEDALSAGKI